MRHPDDYILISSAAVERFAKFSPGFPRFLTRCAVPGGPVRRFPNGAIEINEVGVDGSPEEHPLLPYAAAGCEIEGAGSFRTLGPFQPKRFYCIQYPIDYQQRLRSELTFHAGEGAHHPSAPSEFELTQLRVAAEFRTRVDSSIRRAFVDAIAAWGRAAAEHGAFDGGPVRLASPGVTFAGTRAQFQIDASRSGQDTLNWLSLAILDFAYQSHPITSITYGQSDEELDKRYGIVKGKPNLIPFSDTSAFADVRSGIEAASVSYVPWEASPDSTFHSKSFRVLTLPFDEWDDFVATVYFGRVPQPVERRQFADLIAAWHKLGAYGGFGGVGTHCAEEIEFDDTTDSAIIRADMGDADPAIALAILIRSLEGFESGVGTPIDALVFGTL